MVAGAPAGEGAAASGVVIHVVKSGENLTRIGKQYGVSVAALRAANNLKTDRINAGQKLKVPASRVKTASAEGTPAVLPPVEPAR